MFDGGGSGRPGGGGSDSCCVSGNCFFSSPIAGRGGDSPNVGIGCLGGTGCYFVVDGISTSVSLSSLSFLRSIPVSLRSSLGLSCNFKYSSSAFL